MHFISGPTGLLVAACSRRPVRVPLDRKKKSAVAKATADFLVGCPVGLEPTVSRSTILEGSCSIHLSYGRTLLSHWVPVWRQCVSAHAARSIIPYSGDPVKNKFENSRFLKSKALNAPKNRLCFCGFYHNTNRPSGFLAFQPRFTVHFHHVLPTIHPFGIDFSVIDFSSRVVHAVKPSSRRHWRNIVAALLYP